MQVLLLSVSTMSTVGYCKGIGETFLCRFFLLSVNTMSAVVY
jgi:hypothetical protein